MRGEPPPAPPPRVRGLRSLGATTPGFGRSTARRPKRRHHLRLRCFSAPNSPFSRPIFPLAFFSGLKPQEGGGLGRGKKDGKEKGNVPLPSTPDISPNLLPDGRSPGPPRGSRAGRGHFPATARSEATEGGRGESPPPAHLPGPRALRLRWRAGRLCPRPRKPPAPPAAAEASQRLRIATAAAAAAAVAALLPRGSRSGPASTGAGPTAARGRGGSAAPA